MIANIVTASSTSRVWRPWRYGWLAVPVGLMVLVAGFLVTAARRIDGELILAKGETSSSVMLPNRSQLTLLSRRGDDAQSSELGFSPGPLDWRDDHQLDFGEVDGTRVKVLRFYRHARYQPAWVEDDSEHADPAIQVSVTNSQLGTEKQRWVVPVLFGNAPVPGEPSVSIYRADVSSLQEDFLAPRLLSSGSLGLLSAHCNGRVYSLAVDDCQGKKTPLGDTGIVVEIVEYYANAKSKQGQFVSHGTNPENPMLLLRVQIPDRDQPITEIAYANKPFVNYASIKKQHCPVRFWYHHPAAVAASGIEFLELPNAKLFCRVGSGGAYQSRGEVRPGDRIEIAHDRAITLLAHLTHARKDNGFVPIKLAPGEKSDAEAAVLVELARGDASKRIWLGRNDFQLGVQSVELAGEPRVVMFGYERMPLGFSLRLVDMHRDTDRDPADGACTAQVEISDRPDTSSGPMNSRNRTITAAKPIRFGKFTISQVGVRTPPNHAELSVLRVTSDPGRFTKYAGCVTIVVGIFLMVCSRVFELTAGKPRRTLKTMTDVMPQVARSGVISEFHDSNCERTDVGTKTRDHRLVCTDTRSR